MEMNITFPKLLRRSRTEIIRREPKSRWRRYASLITLAVVLVLWQLVTSLEMVPRFLVPSPLAVGEKFIEVVGNGRLLTHTWVTLIEVLAGLAVGTVLAVVLGYAIARNAILEDFLSPVIVAFQSTPVVAYAPLLIIWFGSGITSKIVTCALIVFFPMLMNTIVGIRNVPGNLRDLMRVSQASAWQTFTKLEVPAAMPVLLTGLKTGATLAVIGAVVGEFINANAGLGFLVKAAREQYDTPLVFVGVIALAVMARVLYGIVSMLERRLLAWQRDS
jgi:NitT/TauT family transport system permease protein